MNNDWYAVFKTDEASLEELRSQGFVARNFSTDKTLVIIRGTTVKPTVTDVPNKPWYIMDPFLNWPFLSGVEAVRLCKSEATALGESDGWVYAEPSTRNKFPVHTINLSWDPKRETDSPVWRAVASILYKQSANTVRPTSCVTVVNVADAAKPGDLRLVDVENKRIVCFKAGISNVEPTILDLGRPRHMQLQAMLELQARVPAGGSLMYAHSLSMV